MKGRAGRTWGLRLEEDRSQTVGVLTAYGRIAAADTGRWRTALESAAGETGLVVDVSAVDYISGAGLEALGEAASRLGARGRLLVLCGVTDPVRIALQLSGVIDAVRIETGREGAIDAARTA